MLCCFYLSANSLNCWFPTLVDLVGPCSLLFKILLKKIYVLCCFLRETFYFERYGEEKTWSDKLGKVV